VDESQDVVYYESRKRESNVYYESIKRELKSRLIYEYRCDERLKTKNEESTRLADTGLLFIIRVKRELKRVYINGCRYYERLNAETEGSKTPRIHWVARVNI
jgi:hypothetical protein